MMTDCVYRVYSVYGVYSVYRREKKDKTLAYPSSPLSNPTPTPTHTHSQTHKPSFLHLPYNVPLPCALPHISPLKFHTIVPDIPDIHVSTLLSYRHLHRDLLVDTHGRAGADQVSITIHIIDPTVCVVCSVVV